MDINLLGTAEGLYYGTFNDIIYTDGDIDTISGINKLKQDSTKILITEIGEGKVFTGYGSNLQGLLNTNVTDLSIQKSIQNAITYAFSYLKNINDSTDPAEQIAEVKSIDIRYDSTDMRKIYLRVEIINLNGQTATVTLGG